jgi:hypothetical protein
VESLHQELWRDIHFGWYVSNTTPLKPNRTSYCEEVGLKHFDDCTLHNRHGSLLFRLFDTVNVQSLGNDVDHGGGKPEFRLGRQRTSSF